MKNPAVSAILLFATSILLAGSPLHSNTAQAQTSESVDLIQEEFPEKQAAIMAMMQDLGASVMAGDVDKLIAFHAYGPKFTEFRAGNLRNGGDENEAFERSIFANVTEVIKFDTKDLKIAVYDKVANVTLHSDFHLMMGENEVFIRDQITLLLVETPEGWKIVHEHHSPLNSE